MEIKRAIFSILIVFFASITLMSCNNQESKGNENMTSDFKEKITQDLPVGTPKEVIEQYLSKNNIEHSWFKEESNFRAIVRDVEVNGLVAKSISITISVDENSKLSEIKIESVFTGL